MDIPTDEYEQRRSLFDFCTWINARLNQFDAEPDFEAHYFERLGLNVKELLEEAIPVSRLGLYLYREWEHMYIHCLSDNQPFDAHLEIHKHKADMHKTPVVERIRVEVTTTETDESLMRRQALSRKGFAIFTGYVSRNKHDIQFEGEMVDVDEAAGEAIQLAFDRMRKKVERTKNGTPYYGADVAVLVHVNFFRSLSSRHRAELIERTRQYLRIQERAIYGIYYYYTWNHGVDGLRNCDQDLW